jgi:hypothetical protein
MSRRKGGKLSWLKFGFSVRIASCAKMTNRTVRILDIYENKDSTL